jgi:hypothetical protein
MRYSKRTLGAAFALALASAGCESSTEPRAEPATLLVEDFNQEGGGTFKLNFNGFTRWNVVTGSVDLIGTDPYDDFLPTTQGLYVDLDGTSNAAGTMETKETFALPRGTYELRFKLAGTPRENQQANTVIVSLGTSFQESISLGSYAPLQSFVRTIKITRETSGKVRFQHQGGDNFGILIDDVSLVRL